MTVRYDWRGEFSDSEVEALHTAGFGHETRPGHPWRQLVDRHSLGWVCARDAGHLVGFANVAWDGSAHAFILDVVVDAPRRRDGIGTALVGVAVREARHAGCEWLHVDFEAPLRGFYLDGCGFRPTPAGLLRLTGD